VETFVSGSALSRIGTTMTDASLRPRSRGLSAAVVTFLAGNLVVTLCNLFRDVAIAASLGASLSADYFFLAISIPVFVISVTGSSYRSVVVPYLVRKAAGARGSFHAAISRLTWLNVTGVVGISGLCASVLSLGYLFVVRTATDTGSASLLSAMLLVIPMYALSGFIEMGQGVLQASGSLMMPNLSRAALPIGILFGAGLLGPRAGMSGLILGGTVGAAIGVFVIAWQLSRHGVPMRRVRAKLPAPEARQFLQNFRAMLVAASINHLTPLIGQWLAGLLGPGSVSDLGYANRLTVGAAALIAGSLTPVLLEFFAREGDGDDATSRGRTFFEIATAFAWTGCCMTLGFWITSEYLIEFIYKRGEFTEADARHVTLLANCFAMQFPVLFAGAAATSLISAQGLNRVFVPICVALLISNVLLTIVLMNLLGAAGIALASSLTYVMSFTLFVLTLIRRKVINPDRVSLQQFSAPFAILAGAGSLVFLGAFRITTHTDLLQYAGAGFLLATFAVLTIAFNRRFIRRALASWRGS
jgi:putative peptidoglycan lipid II flippase